MVGLIAYYFRIVTPIAIFANLIVVPLIAVIISMGMALLLAGLVFTPLATAFATCTRVLLNVMVAFVFLCVKVPGAYFLLEKMSLWTVFLYYSCLILSIWGMKWFVNKDDTTRILVTN